MVVKESSVQIEEKYPELVKLIQTGKERGFIMYEELYDNLPEEVTGIAEELDDIYMRLSELDIDIMDAENADAEGREGERRAKAAEKQAAAKVETRPVATEQLEKTNDPVRMYLREMGTVKLLDRDGEVDIAQRIESGEARVFIALSKETSLLELFLRTNERARRERRGVRELLQGQRRRARREGRGARPYEGLRLFRTISAPRRRVASELKRACAAASGPASGTRSCRTRSTPTPPRPPCWSGGPTSPPPPGTGC
jgi:RNA polymerase primary sigma factor